MERREYIKGRSMSGSCTHAGRNIAENECIKFYGVFERKKQHDVIWQFSELKYKYRNREFWSKGYYVDTAVKNAERIAEYIANQLREDQLGEQLTLEWENPFKGSR